MSGEDAAYELKVDLPGLPKGEQVQIAGLGTFENGSTYSISKDEADRYRSYHSRQVDIFDEHDNRVGADVEPGPTLLKAFKSTQGVDVSTAGSSSSEEEPSDEEVDDEESSDDGGESQ